MNITQEGSFYQISHITGPTHNRLWISFLEDSEPDLPLPPIECLPAMGECNHEALNPDAIQREALAGVTEANLRFGTSFRVKRLQYLENDVPPEGIYRYLARMLVEHLTQMDKR